MIRALIFAVIFGTFWTPAVCNAGNSSAPTSSFPATGHTYRVDFISADGSQKFSVELVFASEKSMTYTGVRSDGSHGASETVATEITPIAPQIFLVTWKESDKTTVVHVEDYRNMIFYTNITDGGDLHDFSKFKGTVRLIK